jgi:hypothetical protein
LQGDGGLRADRETRRSADGDGSRDHGAAVSRAFDPERSV